MTQNTSKILEVKTLSKSFKVGSEDVPVLKDINIEVNNTDFCIIFGPSGSGKSTLLHTILGLEPPTSGSVKFLNFDLYNLSEDDISDFRKKQIGIIYQQSYWVKALTVLHNVAFPLLLNGYPWEKAEKLALERLSEVGMADWAGYYPTELSGGQQQKVGLARCLVTDPLVIIADEPTGNLDTQAGDNLMDMLKKLNKEKQKTVILVTHDLEYLSYATKLIQIIDGSINRVSVEGDKNWVYLTSLRGKRSLFTDKEDNQNFENKGVSSKGESGGVEQKSDTAVVSASGEVAAQ